jgi:hypothetical protein
MGTGESNLTWWINELARTDRHRALHIGLGRVDEHRIRVLPPPGVTVQFDETVDPYSHIEQELVVGRLTASRPLQPREITADLRGVAIAPEIRSWADFRLAGKRRSLQDRMVYAEIFTRNNLENMALMGHCVPPGGFRTFDPAVPTKDQRLVVLRRLRNRATHQTSLPRTWTTDDRGGGDTPVGITGIPNLNPFEYLQDTCNRVSDLTEQMLAMANAVDFIGVSTRLRRERW